METDRRRSRLISPLSLLADRTVLSKAKTEPGLHYSASEGSNDEVDAWWSGEH